MAPPLEPGLRGLSDSASLHNVLSQDDNAIVMSAITRCALRMCVLDARRPGLCCPSS